MGKFTIGMYRKGESSVYTASTVEAETVQGAKQKAWDILGKEFYTACQLYECLPEDLIIDDMETVIYPKIEAIWVENYNIGTYTETTEDEYDYFLECLPPEKWKTVNGVNIFRMCEYAIGSITEHFIRVKDHLDNKKTHYFRAHLDTTATDYKQIAEDIHNILDEMELKEDD